MEGSESRSGAHAQARRSSPEIVDLDLEEEAVRGRVPDPVEVVDLEEEAELDDDDIIVLDGNLEIQELRADSPEIEILAVNPPRPSPELIDLGSESDSEVQVVEILPPRSPMVISVEDEEEENLPVSVEEEEESKEDEEAVASPNLEASGVGFSLSSVKQELGEASSSIFSISDVKREVEAQAADVTSLAESMGQVAIAEKGNESSSLENGDMTSGSSPQPSSSSNVLENPSPPVDLAHESGKETQSGNTPAPVERVRVVGKTRIAYVSKPDFSSLSEQDKIKLRDRMLRRIFELQKQCKFDQYVQRYPPGSIKIENGFKTIRMKDKDGVTRKIIFKPEECREADEQKADPAYELPTRPTPKYLDLLLQNMHLNEGEGSSGSHVKEKLVPGTSKGCLDETVGASMLCPEVKQPRFEWDTQESVDEFCQKFNDSFDAVAKEREEEKKAKEAARLLGKENRRKAIAAMLAEIQQGGRKKTRLATGTITRKVTTTSVKVENSSPKPSVSPSKGQQRKRKVSEVETSSEIGIVSVPTLNRRPTPRDGTSVLKAPSSPSLPQFPMLSTPTPGTSQPAEIGPTTCPIGNDAGWIKEDEWEVECVVDVRVEKDDSSGRNKNRIMYKVKWRGWESTHNSWVPENNILTKAPIKTFWRRFKKGTKKLNCQILKARLAKSRSRRNKGYFML